MAGYPFGYSQNPAACWQAAPLILAAELGIFWFPLPQIREISRISSEKTDPNRFFVRFDIVGSTVFRTVRGLLNAGGFFRTGEGVFHATDSQNSAGLSGRSFAPGKGS
jgi:hypothetical protein